MTFQAHSGQVGLVSWGDARIGASTPADIPEGALPMPDKRWHQIRIVDDGKAVAVYHSGPAIHRARDGKPVIQAPYTGAFRKHRVAIYNREFVAGALHESHVRNVSVGPPAGEKRE